MKESVNLDRFPLAASTFRPDIQQQLRQHWPVAQNWLQIRSVTSCASAPARLMPTQGRTRDRPSGSSHHHLTLTKSVKDDPSVAERSAHSLSNN